VIQTARYRHLMIPRGTAIHRDLGDTGIVTFGITILSEVLSVSHNTSVDRALRCGHNKVIPARGVRRLGPDNNSQMIHCIIRTTVMFRRIIIIMFAYRQRRKFTIVVCMLFRWIWRAGNERTPCKTITNTPFSGRKHSWYTTV